MSRQVDRRSADGTNVAWWWRVAVGALVLAMGAPASATLLLTGNFVELPIDDGAFPGRFMANGDAQGAKYNAAGTGGATGVDCWQPGSPVYNYTIAVGGSTFLTNGVGWAAGPTVTDLSLGTLHHALIEGDPVPGLHFRREVLFLDTDQVVQIIDFIANVGASPFTQVATLDSTDPDQDANPFSSFITSNDVVNAASPKDLVVATGTISGVTLGFGSPSAFRLVDASGFDLTNPYPIIAVQSDPNGANGDIDISLVMNYGTLSPGDSHVTNWRIAFGATKNAAISHYVGSLGVCGNGVVEPGEACDEGANNGNAASCCTTSCTPVCDDADPCTDDLCDSTGAAFVCSHPFNTAPCTPADRCIVGATCSSGTCSGGSPRVCNDGNPCTDDFCNGSTGGCFTLPNADPCNDLNPCTDDDRCSFGICRGTNNNAPCDDANPCTGNDRCSFGFCQPGAPLSCDDHNECTTEFCQPFVGCVFTPLSGIRCQDDNPCTTDDVCVAGVCTGDPRNCFDDDPCTVDSCNSAGGAFLCQHEDCNGVPESNCPAACRPIFCGNGRIDPGETCDPPDATIQPGRPGQVTCRPNCTFCGDGVPQPGQGETCDDGNLVTGCNPAHPTQPLDGCQTSCTPPICQDPAKIRYRDGVGILDVHGRIEPVAPATTLDPASQTFVVELTDTAGTVLYRSSLEAGLIEPRGAGFKYADRTAKVGGGISRLKFAPRGTSYRVTLTAYGDLSAATGEMTTHLFIGAQEWTLAGRWLPSSNGWKLDTRTAP